MLFHPTIAFIITSILACKACAQSPKVLSTPVYDYVVVGGGTAGLTIANRLTEDKDVTVAVLEAGFNAEGLPEVFIPGLIGTGISLTTLNWAYNTVPQTNLNGRTLTVRAGKALGGSTVINSMIFPRAEKEQYDVWGQLNNDSTWMWENLLPFFKKSELFSPPNAFQVASGVRYLPSVHGFSGCVKVGFPNFFFAQSALWSKAAQGVGFPASPDLANGDPHAVGIAPNSIDAANNTRCSAACAYYTPFVGRSNLVVITNATVSRILWAKSGANSALTASGVEYLVNNQTQMINVSKEVILSAGTVGSPKVLELSGVGNSTILKAAGVTPVLNLPTVGENFADHVHSRANAFTNITLTKDALLLNPAFAAEQEALWFKNRTGLFSAVPRSLGIAAPSDVFTPSQLSMLIAQAEANLTHFATQFSNGNPALAKGIAAQHKIALALYQQNKELPLEMSAEPGYSGPTAFSARPARNYTTINSVLHAPFSRGRTHIVSSNPLTPPAVDPAYWAHPIDVAAQVGGIKLARRMLVAPPLDSIYNGEFEPGADKDTDAKIEEWLRGVVTSENHEVGSLSMMPQSLGGVVDTALKVYGTANVRVADVSIIPFPVSAHLSSTVYMIGERTADIIRGGKA
ncbi:alcohol oxidase [Mycena epipterygia]|nr:alcohol oxidase [Mycena epipterygia]